MKSEYTEEIPKAARAAPCYRENDDMREHPEATGTDSPRIRRKKMKGGFQRFLYHPPK